MKNLIKQVIFDQKQYSYENTVERIIPGVLINNDEVLVISGIRRCGKSVLLNQIRAKQKEKDFYLNFDDDRLTKFKVEHFQQLYEVFIELFGKQKTFYFDEIQNIEGWELFVRRLYDEGCKVYVTGSNARMLSKELGTHLTGRYCAYELYPFSFTEFLALKKVKVTPSDYYSTEGIANITKLFNTYIRIGGFPQYIKTENDTYLKSLYESILYRDVMVRNKLTNEKEILELVYYLASNVAKPFSYNALTKMIGLKHSATVKNYIELIENTYLLSQVSKFDFSLKKQIYNHKKIYFIDNAIVYKLGFNFSENMGRLLENLVFVELKRRSYEVFYHSDKTECDFVVREGSQITQLIQVCYQLTDENKEREIKGLKDAMHQYRLGKGIILTADREEQELHFHDKEIVIIPVWKWLLEYSNMP